MSISHRVRSTIRHACVGLLVLPTIHAAIAQEPDTMQMYSERPDGLVLTSDGASHFARLALDCIHKEYPNKLNQVLQNEDFLLPPRTLHPSFYGCFDWHSSVHGHWMLVKLLREFPGIAERVIGCSNCREAGPASGAGAQSSDDRTKARSLGGG